ncbi:MAG: Stage III sporulation protein AG [Caldanaerobacter subterraneus]|uniref:Stage III sporulation protein AG n=2 Tax=Caldanaerobacter subterraneus TaxID=911092 RepID=Q8RAD4_CALS4|nr:stage III sporulation protein AG [Caldanaerobacter subterraneus]AAM24513.1 stage III sporulation protein AG [Caldanaerobacter subterraneus subsp. tengcongensis MB4]KUK09724.1 MAG: Stage III sporulation protein AG [Caldanaerobacter subterraneus]MBE3579581.1 stage III sporulation protein AG [Caldanaerobacter subterraneus]MCS3915925.1 stage III sporulation protein AG [Caldanaerobacter subterraneus subsp. tengcongensis MB4]TCO68424.1 stage III sporulation protein AG [Caldanaerobacter subterrane
MDFTKLKDKFLKDNKKLLENLTVIFLIGLILLIGASTFSKPRPSNESDNKELVLAEKQNEDYAKRLERDLKSILSKIEGVGNVEVLITLNSDEEVVAAMDVVQSSTTTNEKDSNGTVREVVQTESNNKIVTSQNPSGQNAPIVLKRLMPEIRGVIVVADGAKDPRLRYEISSAVQTALGIPAYKVKVISSK